MTATHRDYCPGNIALYSKLLIHYGGEDLSYFVKNVRVLRNPNATASDTPVWVPQRRSWTDADVAKMKEKIVPEGHSLSSVRAYASAHHIPFNRIRRRQTPQKERVALLKDDIVKELQSTGKIRATARKFGLAYTSVRNIAIEIGLVA